MQSSTFPARLAVLSFSLAFTAAVPTVSPASVFAQTPAPAKATPQRGTVKSIEGGSLTLTTDTGQEVVITVPGTARIQRLAPAARTSRPPRPPLSPTSPSATACS